MVVVEEVIILIVIVFALWYFIGSIIGRRIMRRTIKSCIDRGGSLRLLTSSSSLVEYKGDDKYYYLGLYVDWLPFDNIINLPLRLLTRPRPLVIIKAEPKKKIQGYLHLIVEPRGKALKGEYSIKYHNMSKERASKILDEASKRGFEKVVIGDKPNTTIITVLRDDCATLLERVREFTDAIS
ncbi:MAG: hypothetical protein QXD97_06925 [Acidilobaceae archaeon]